MSVQQRTAGYSVLLGSAVGGSASLKTVLSAWGVDTHAAVRVSFWTIVSLLLNQYGSPIKDNKGGMTSTPSTMAPSPTPVMLAGVVRILKVLLETDFFQKHPPFQKAATGKGGVSH
jgi:hypothetical protein